MTANAVHGPAIDSPPTETIRFGHLTIDFDARVLRPRPWTVSQSLWAADVLRSAPAGPVLELCAGVGQIGLLALRAEDRELMIVDVDETACGYARANARRAGLAGEVTVRCAALDEALAPHELFAFAIADPPWVPSHAVANHPDDPVRAIDGGADGLAMARACLDLIAAHLLPNGSALIQLGSEEQAMKMNHFLARKRAPRLCVKDVKAHGNSGVLALLRHVDSE